MFTKTAKIAEEIMEIRRAEARDIPYIAKLLHQVHDVHSAHRPDIFNRGNRKYNDEEIGALIADDTKPIYVADEDGAVLGYAFCIIEEVKDIPALVDMKSLYIDDLCVDEEHRGKHIGTALYEFVLSEAKRLGCYHVTLNVWNFNDAAMRFYEKCGLKPLKTVMEKIV